MRFLIINSDSYSHCIYSYPDHFNIKNRFVIVSIGLSQVLREEKEMLVKKDQALAAKFKQFQEEMIRLQVALVSDISSTLIRTATTTTTTPSSMSSN